MSEKSTKKVKPSRVQPMRAEYRRDSSGVGIRGKYLKQHSQGTNLVLLQPEVAKAFSTPEAANEALRGLMQIAKRVTLP